jgi:cytochrome c peroxidase
VFVALTATLAVTGLGVAGAIVRGGADARGAAGAARAARGSATADAAAAVYAAGLDRLDGALARLDTAVASGDGDAARAAFRAARAAYKRVELFTEYYGVFAVRELNGAPIPFAESEDPETPLAPVGLQVVEAELFPAGGAHPDTRPGARPGARLDARRVPATRQLVTYMRGAVRTLRRAGVDTMPGDAYLWDAARHELARVATLGIAGFDAAVTGDGVVESAEALLGVRDALAPWRDALARRDPGALRRLDARLDSAVAYLRAHPDFERLDRLAFLARYAIPAAHAVADAQRALGVAPPPQPRAWSARGASPYDRSAFDPMFFAALDAPRPTPALVALGRDLFFDATLSPSGTRSCATCHVPERAFTDGRPRAALLAGHRARGAARNTPTLLNAALQPTLFADNRVRTLEDQATDVLGSPGEMGGSLHAAAEALRRRGEYVDRFARAFGAARDTALTPRTLRLALAAYVRSLTALDSRFDRAVRGDEGALTAGERDGFRVFMGKARCGTCHFAPLFNGATPPTLLEAEPEVIGVPAWPARRHAVVDADSGRFNVRRIDQHLHAFKTPTLRNVALTAPYMHNGVYRTLEEVVDFYDGGGGAGIGVGLPHQTLPPDSLRLTRREKGNLVAFLRALTDTAGAAR